MAKLPDVDCFHFALTLLALWPRCDVRALTMQIHQRRSTSTGVMAGLSGKKSLPSIRVAPPLVVGVWDSFLFLCNFFFFSHSMSLLCGGAGQRMKDGIEPQSAS
jgi:hypothetical protein